MHVIVHVGGTRTLAQPCYSPLLCLQALALLWTDVSGSTWRAGFCSSSAIYLLPDPIVCCHLLEYFLELLNTVSTAVLNRLEVFTTVS